MKVIPLTLSQPTTYILLDRPLLSLLLLRSGMWWCGPENGDREDRRQFFGGLAPLLQVWSSSGCVVIGYDRVKVNDCGVKIRILNTLSWPWRR